MFNYKVGIHDEINHTRKIIAINSFSVCDDRITLYYNDDTHATEYNYPLSWVEYIVDIKEEKKIIDTQKEEEVAIWIDNDKCLNNGIPMFKTPIRGKIVNNNNSQIFLEKDGELKYIIPFDIIKIMRPYIRKDRRI